MGRNETICLNANHDITRPRVVNVCSMPACTRVALYMVGKKGFCGLPPHRDEAYRLAARKPAADVVR